MKIDKDTQTGVLLSLAQNIFYDFEEISNCAEFGSPEMEEATKEIGLALGKFSEAWGEARKARGNE